MDSGNSGSMQSSSGGDEEYDSRGESISNFLNQSGHFDSIISSSNPQPQFLSHQQSSLFHSQNPDATFPQSLANPNSQYSSNDLVWPRGLRSEPGYGNFANLVPSPSSSSSSSPLSLSTTQALFGAHQRMINNQQSPFSSSSSLSSIQPTVEMRASDAIAHQPKNPKKRTRASRRAPTTVLTTDTTNFRQMVQEFTGIPTAPFSVGSPYSRRLDLFSTAGSAMRSAHLDGLGPLYPLRPSAQKVQMSPFLNTSMLDALMPANNTSSGGNNATTTTSIVGATNGSGSNSLGNPDLGITKQGPNLFSMQNQILAFHPLLQTSIKNPLGNANAPDLGTRSQGGSNLAFMNDALGMINNEQVSANLGGFPTQQGINDGGSQMRSFEGNNGNYKPNSSTSSTSEFHPEKGLENVP